jgi:MYXO-CTERM domain-containing protein
MSCRLSVGATLALVLCTARAGYANADRECMDDAACVMQCEQAAAALRAPDSWSTSFSSSECLGMTPPEGGGSVVPLRGCACNLSDAAFVLLNPFDSGECLFWGRARQCLYQKNEFPGCDIASPNTSCDSVCAELESRIQSDEAASYDVAVQGALCRSYQCVCVLDIEGSCYVEGCLTNPHLSYDCSRDPQAVVDQACPVYGSEPGCGCRSSSSPGASRGAWVLAGIGLTVCRRWRRRRS